MKKSYPELIDLIREKCNDILSSEEEEDEDLINVAVIGKPNAGKSSLINRLVGEDRVIVSNIAGTTRDAIDTRIEKNGVKYNNDAFIKKLYNIWGDKYKVSENQTYTNAHTKMRFICNEHGEFETKPYYLLQGHGCPICGINTVSEKLKMEQDDFIKKSIKIHNNKYNYNKSKFF